MTSTTRSSERLAPLGGTRSALLELRSSSLQSLGVLPGLADSLPRSHKLSGSSGTSTIAPRSAVSRSLSLSKASTTTGDWFSRNLRDSGITDLTRSLTRDGQLNRKDMLAILRTSRDGGSVNGGELKDLQIIVSNTSRFTVKNYIRVLSNKVVNGNVANQTYQGGRLGNLSADSSSTHLDKLIGKWFLGKDRPTTGPGYTHRQASGSLFRNGVSYKDIEQGLVGDCYFLASLGAVARRTASTIQNMFVDNGDNTYTVRFYNNGVADYVTVDKYLPTDASKRFVYASYGNSSSSSRNELWVALAEKAYAQLNQSGWIGQDNNNSYRGIESGLGYYAMRHITGRSTTYGYTPSGLGSSNFTAMVNAFKDGKSVTVGTKAFSQASNLVPGHEYIVVDYNSSTRKLKLFNPWGVSGGHYNGQLKPGTVEINASSLSVNFDYWARTV